MSAYPYKDISVRAKINRVISKYLLSHIDLIMSHLSYSMSVQPASQHGHRWFSRNFLNWRPLSKTTLGNILVLFLKKLTELHINWNFENAPLVQPTSPRKLMEMIKQLVWMSSLSIRKIVSYSEDFRSASHKQGTNS